MFRAGIFNNLPARSFDFIIFAGSPIGGGDGCARFDQRFDDAGDCIKRLHIVRILPMQKAVS